MHIFFSDCNEIDYIIKSKDFGQVKVTDLYKYLEDKIQSIMGDVARVAGGWGQTEKRTGMTGAQSGSRTWRRWSPQR